MTLGKQMVETLRRLAAEGPETVNTLAWGEGDRCIGVDVDRAHARLDFVDHDRYSVALRALEVELDARSAPVDARAELSARAAEVTRRLSYLEEPLAVWELEGGERTAQLRSSPPQREGEEIFYWEVALRGGERPAASITRYRWTPGMPEREPVVYPATFALIGRIADSLGVALAE
ncbi:MAG: hypothetical protein RLZZ387_3049 [Chloroflexota bacterium]|jgi:hypothetical protein